MVEVFKTNVEEPRMARDVLYMLSHLFPSARIDLDLEDSDKVLRIEGSELCPVRVIELMKSHGFDCSILE